MIGIERELGPVFLLCTESVEAFHRGATVRAIDPLTRRPPPELSRRRLLRQGIACVEQRLGVYTDRPVFKPLFSLQQFKKPANSVYASRQATYVSADCKSRYLASSRH
jgi:hypothetical protein